MTNMNAPFLLAAGWCFAIALVHTFIGSRTDLRPLLKSDLPATAKATLFYCRHIVTLLLFAMAGSFAWSGLAPQSTGPAAAALGAARRGRRYFPSSSRQCLRQSDT